MLTCLLAHDFYPYMCDHVTMLYLSLLVLSMHCVACSELSLALDLSCLWVVVCSFGFLSFRLVLELFFWISLSLAFSLASGLWLRGSSASFDGKLVSRACVSLWIPVVIVQLVPFLWYSIGIFWLPVVIF